ncbi:MAG: hypothetical protein WB661_06400 [Candidatus Bathyarchaeia archaeon]
MSDNVKSLVILLLLFCMATIPISQGTAQQLGYANHPTIVQNVTTSVNSPTTIGPSIGTINPAISSGNFSLVASGFTQPEGMAIDSNGNIFVAEDLGQSIKEIHTDGTIETLLSGTNYNVGLAIDATGNLFFASYWGNTIQELPVGCHSMSCVVTVLNTAYPRGVGVDSLGNLYFTWSNNNLPAGKGNGGLSVLSPNGTVTALLTGLDHPDLLSLGSDGCAYWGTYPYQPPGPYSGISEVEKYCLGDSTAEILYQDTVHTTFPNFGPIVQVIPDVAGVLYWTQDSDNASWIWKLNETASPNSSLVMDMPCVGIGQCGLPCSPYCVNIHGLVFDAYGNGYFDNYYTYGGASAASLIRPADGGADGTVYRLSHVASPRIELMVTPQMPVNGTLIDGSYQTLTAKVTSNPPSTFVTGTNVTIYVNGAPICTNQISPTTGLVSCPYEVTTQGTYRWNGTAQKPGTFKPAVAPQPTFTFTAGPVGAVSLVAGWNLISLPLVPANTMIGKVLGAQLAANDFASVWSYQKGKWIFATQSNGNLSGPLTMMSDGLGYWVFMTKAGTLYVTGTVIPPAASPPAYALTGGWNLVGFKPQPQVVPETVGNYLTSINGAYDSSNVWVYTGTGWVRADASYMLQPGQGMWLLMTAPAMLRP